jgi:hypothetical protein
MAADMAADGTNTTARPTPASTAPAGTRRLGLALVVISLAQLMLVLDELIVNTALPHIQRTRTSPAPGWSGWSPDTR